MPVTVEGMPRFEEEMTLGFSQLSPCWNLGKGCEESDGPKTESQKSNFFQCEIFYLKCFQIIGKFKSQSLG